MCLKLLPGMFWEVLEAAGEASEAGASLGDASDESSDITQ